ncbi:MAG TPA: Gfo/Idh/MocA family oxidoreductase [Candidatus Faecivicinus avistercoris]|nr:Gfo/Idh/MocA family oxidoreductase [Candidatus Faecivicinus avistercoris]
MNKTLKVGIAGGRGLSTMLGFQSLEGVEVAALCDLDEDLLRAKSAEHNIPHTYRIFDDMLESDIDAVVIATPMQCHVPQAIAALEAGKHVLSEVTAGVTIDELWWLKESVEKSRKTYMYAENYCYMPSCQQIRQMVRLGLFGDVYYGECEYLHNVRSLLTYPSGKTSWRAYWQLGKRGAFYPTHSIGPMMQWFEGERIASVSCFSAGHHNGLRQDDTSVAMCPTKSGKLIKLRVDCVSPRPHNMTGYQLQGTRGAFESARERNGRNIVWLDTLDENVDNAQWRDLADFSEYLPERYRKATEEQNRAGHGGGDFFLVEDFVNAVRLHVKPDIDVYQACEWTAVGLLSELSVMNGGRTIDMPDFRKNCVDDQIIRL